MPPEFSAYISAVEGAKSWVDTKAAMQRFYTTDLFKGMTVDQQNKIRADTWEALQEKELKDLPDHAQDVSAFRLWIEWCEDPDAIIGTLRVLENEEVFNAKEPSFKQIIRQAVANRTDRLGHS